MVPDTVIEGRAGDAARRFCHCGAVAGPLQALRSKLPAAARPLIVGGALRNLMIGLLHGDAPVTRDIDVFIGGPDAAFPLKQALADQRVERTALAAGRFPLRLGSGAVGRFHHHPALSLDSLPAGASGQPGF